MPSDIFLSAYSVTTIEPSINIPNPKSKPIIIRKLNSIFAKYKTVNVNKNENGIDNPTSNPTLSPILATTSITTRNIAVTIFPCSSLIICSAQMVSSLVLTIFIFSGNEGLKSLIAFTIKFFASIAFAPSLSLISRLTASLPLIFE